MKVNGSKFAGIFTLISILLISFVLMVTPALALQANSPGEQLVGPAYLDAPDEADDAPAGMFEGLVQQFMAFGGVGIAVMLVVALIKLPSVITKGKIVLLPKGWAGHLVTLLNLSLFVVFVIGKTYYPDFNYEGLDADFQKYANYGMKLIGLIVQLWGSSFSYNKLKEATPAVSYSAMKTFG